MSKEIISKELLSLVVEKEVEEIHHVVTDHDLLIPETRIIFSTKDEVPILNADTLGRICKEWCRDSDLYLLSYISQLGGVCEVLTEFNEKAFDSSKLDCKTELEAIIKATEWVAKEKGLLK